MLLGVSQMIPSSLFLVSQSAEVIIVTLLTTPCAYVCCVYAPPACSLSIFHEITRCLSAIPNDSFIIVTGDFNLPDVNWSTMMAASVEGVQFWMT